MPNIEYRLTRQQSLAFLQLTNEEDLSILFGGGKGGGKSFLFCLWVDHWARHLINFFGITKIPKEPIPIGFIGRKQGIDFTRTTLQTFQRFIPADHYEIKNQEIIFDQKVKVYYGGLDDQERIRKFNSAELAFIGIDQAEETERNDVDVLQASLRLVVNGKQPPYKQLYTANPADCWLKEDFIINQRPHKYFIPALYTDNPHLPKNYNETLENAFRYNSALLQAYLKGDWHALQSENSLISSMMLEDLKNINHHFNTIRRVVAIDPSLGGDAAVIKFMENYKVLETITLHERDQMKLAGSMVALAEKWNCNNFAADTTGGLGSAILDRIKELRKAAHCIYVNSSEAASNPESHANVKAEMYWFLMQMIMDKKIPYIEDEPTRTQLLAMRFKVTTSSGKVIMAPKDKVKLRIGRSPDDADCFTIAVFALNQTEPMHAKDAWVNDESSDEVYVGVKNAMAV